MIVMSCFNLIRLLIECLTQSMWPGLVVGHETSTDYILALMVPYGSGNTEVTVTRHEREPKNRCIGLVI